MSILLKMKEAVTVDGKAQIFSTTFKSFNQDEERVRYAMQLFSKYNIKPSKANKQKDAEQSKKWREKGNDIFVHNNTAEHLVESCKLYTKSIAFAPNDSNELSLAYANRSAVLFRLGKYEECIQDIDRCLRLNYPDRLKPKILLRKTECLGMLKNAALQESYDETLKWIEKSLANIDYEQMKKKLDGCLEKKPLMNDVKRDDSASLDPQVFKDFYFDTVSSEVLASSNALAVNYDDKFGRHIIATRDIRPGEIIADESPYCLALSRNNKYSHCWGCLEYTWNSIPCEHCIHSMYCSEKCKEESWKQYHDVECTILMHFATLAGVTEVEDMVTLSLKLAVLAVRELGSISNLMNEVKDIEKCTDLRIKGFSSDGKFHSNKYRSVYSLATNTDKRLPPDLFDRSAYAAILVYYLASATDFFGKILPESWKEMYTNKEITFIGGLIMRHKQIIPSNIHCYSEERNREYYERGMAVMPFFSFANHSCNGNVSRSCLKGHELLYATYPIKKGEQIFDNYGFHYALTRKAVRQKTLYEQFLFSCTCIACKEDWPLYTELQSYQVKVKCSKVKSILDIVIPDLKTKIRSTMLENIKDKPSILKDTSVILEILLKHVTLPCKEVNDVIELIKRIFILNENRFILPKVVS